MKNEFAVAECTICHKPAFNDVQEQVLWITGIGTVNLMFGYCVNCGHIQQTTRASDAVLSAYYRRFSNYTCFDKAAALASPPEPVTKRLMNIVAQYKPEPGSIYEAGCATGKHLHHFRNAGWKVQGCDLSPKAARQAKEVYGLDIEVADADILRQRSGNDVVLFSHVLEHMPDPIQALVAAQYAVKDDGVIIFEVPCSVEPLIQPPGLFTLEHLHYFTYDGVLALCRDCGLEPVEVRVAIHHEKVPVIAVAAKKAKTIYGRCGEPPSHRNGRETALRGQVVRTEAYVNALMAHDNRIWANTAARLRDVKGPVFIWGAGVHTAQLLDYVPGLIPKIAGIVDRDPQKWGEVQHGFTVNAPLTTIMTDSRDLQVVISSHVFEAQIADFLLANGFDESRIVRLYTGKQRDVKELAA